LPEALPVPFALHQVSEEKKISTASFDLSGLLAALFWGMVGHNSQEQEWFYTELIVFMFL
jgi:hypothetical protein